MVGCVFGDLNAGLLDAVIGALGAFRDKVVIVDRERLIGSVF